jgi:hypothetical protein
MYGTIFEKSKFSHENGAWTRQALSQRLLPYLGRLDSALPGYLAFGKAQLQGIGVAAGHARGSRQMP